ncbi:hypothetical protein EBS02_10005, partial [bacterium]|nr:hypothetical protein [bacterium]
MAHRPVGAGVSVSTSTVAAATTSFPIQSDTLRVVATGAAFISVGSTPSATSADYYVPANTPVTLA